MLTAEAGFENCSIMQPGHWRFHMAASKKPRRTKGADSMNAGTRRGNVYTTGRHRPDHYITAIVSRGSMSHGEWPHPSILTT